ncbi:hypothetical protein [Alterisphingorhabdus coralli]|uniref:Outer membrane assembly lipoprotein YfiO n=1 Tax=Alterisphingorhabdus coralli TaxID=3071408 RepID=A0AA97I378_9SPHN|nr:hypothetical protein [Parasphingorhabdus sp. SCSIO 66989]WOE76490.1 hypothetical protein RB602_07190 [Parasphingorhabdus sp. SCSIO 66989]
MMHRILRKGTALTSAILALAGFVASLSVEAVYQPAKASSDSSCYPDWSLANPGQICANNAIIAPGNDTRVNLFLLLSDRNIADDDLSSYPEPLWYQEFGEVYFNWRQIRRMGKQDSPQPDNPFWGSRCASFVGGTADFQAALEQAKKVSAADRATLSEARLSLYALCELQTGSSRRRWNDASGQPSPVFEPIGAKLSGRRAGEYLAYLNGAGAFYSGAFDEAKRSFSRLASAKDPWVKEASRYMLGRVPVNSAQANALDKWGYFNPEAANVADARASVTAFQSYLRDYPQGRYAASAKGLIRRGFWLAGDFDALAGLYGEWLLTAPNMDERRRAIEETDNMLLALDYRETEARGGDGYSPLLQAIHLLRLMRYREERLERSAITGKRDAFEGAQPLYEFVLANYDFYVARDYRSVLELIPDAARQPDFSYLEFSRQALRGQALAMLKDPNEGGFWRDMLGGSKARYQRAAVELGLASFYERNGQLDAVFAADSPITKPLIRKRLLAMVAGADTLRAIADNGERPKNERDLALFTLLYKQLSRGYYAAFARDVGRVGEDADKEIYGLWGMTYSETIPVGLFTKGRSSENIDCPQLKQIAQTLANRPRDYRARLCLGDFFRRNGFDDFSLSGPSHWRAHKDAADYPALGQSANLFPGEAKGRQAIYQDIIADRAAPAQWRSYALYRAIRCYAPANSNSCGGQAVPESQRKSWFQELKRRYPRSKWAKDLQYYW